jgi:hypothetical protein
MNRLYLHGIGHFHPEKMTVVRVRVAVSVAGAGLSRTHMMLEVEETR